MRGSICSVDPRGVNDSRKMMGIYWAKVMRRIILKTGGLQSQRRLFLGNDRLAAWGDVLFNSCS